MKMKLKVYAPIGSPRSRNGNAYDVCRDLLSARMVWSGQFDARNETTAARIIVEQPHTATIEIIDTFFAHEENLLDSLQIDRSKIINGTYYAYAG